MKFSQRIIAMPVLAALAFLVIFVVNVRRAQETDALVQRLQTEVIVALQLTHDLERTALETRHTMTNAVTVGDTDLIGEGDLLAARFRGLTDLGRTTPGLAPARLAAVDSTFGLYFELARETSLALAKAEDGSYSLELLGQVQRMNATYEDLVTDLAALAAEEQAEVEDFFQDAQDRIVRARRVVFLTGALALVLLVGLAVVSVLGVVRPVRNLRDASTAIAGGELDRTVDYHGHDELGELADRFRDMQTALVEDIARREEAEESLRKRSEELATALDDLREAQGRIVHAEKMTALGKLVAGLAHELNTPVGAASSSADLVGRALRIVRGRLAPGTQVDDLLADDRFVRALRALEQGEEGARTASARIAELVAGLKSFTALDQAEFQTARITDGIEDTLTVMSHEFAPGVEVVREFAEVPPILCYPGQLNQLWLTLLRRAAEVVGERGRVRVRIAPGPDDGVTVTVSDSAAGVDPREIDSLFDIRLRADRQHVRMDWSLAAAAQIVRRHGGSIAADRDPDGGTRVRVSLPARPTSTDS